MKTGAAALPVLLLGVLAACAERRPPEAAFATRPERPFELRAELSAPEGPLLAPVTLRVDLWTDSGVVVTWSPRTPSGFAPVTGPTSGSEPALRELFGGSWRHWDLELRPTRTGDLTIPAEEVRAKGRDGKDLVATFPELRFTSRDLLPAEKGAVEPPASAFAPRPWYLVAAPWILGAAVLATLLGWGYARWRRNRRSKPLVEPHETALPPHTKALRALARLRQEPRTSPEQVERFHVELAAVLRVYVEERFGLRAPERTTEEFFAEAQRSPLLAVEQTLELKAFLEHCDLVKFARLATGDADQLRVFAIAERFVEATRQDRAPAQVEAPSPAALVGGSLP